MNPTYKICFIYIINKTLTFHHWKKRLPHTDNINSTIGAIVIEKSFI